MSGRAISMLATARRRARIEHDDLVATRAASKLSCEHAGLLDALQRRSQLGHRIGSARFCDTGRFDPFPTTSVFGARLHRGSGMECSRLTEYALEREREIGSGTTRAPNSLANAIAVYWAHGCVITRSHDETDLTPQNAVERLRVAGLFAKSSKVVPTLLVGGRTEQSVGGICVFHDAFSVSRRAEGDVLTIVACEGNPTREKVTSTLRDAVAWVLGEYGVGQRDASAR